MPFAMLIISLSLADAAPPADKTAQIDIVEKLNAQVPKDARLTDSDGKMVTFGELLQNGMPTLLTVGYFECPMLCDIVLNGVLSGVKGLSFTAGNEFQVVSISIEPKETPALASKKRENYLKSYARETEAHGWRFLTGDAGETKRIADAVGWNYFWDDETKQWAHAAGVFVLTPDGKVSRVLYGIEFPPKDLKLAFVEAGEGKVGTAIDKLILWCYHYSPKDRGYVVFAMRVMRVCGALSVLILGIFIWLMFRADRRRQAAFALEK
ncbi:MAG: SCO family protein [Deltaproteobacteria bacterium]|nr:SCO family protein [Deltaproteobacteria bacterium]